MLPSREATGAFAQRVAQRFPVYGELYLLAEGADIRSRVVSSWRAMALIRLLHLGRSCAARAGRYPPLLYTVRLRPAQVLRTGSPSASLRAMLTGQNHHLPHPPSPFRNELHWSCDQASNST